MCLSVLLLLVSMVASCSAHFPSRAHILRHALSCDMSESHERCQWPVLLKGHEEPQSHTTNVLLLVPPSVQFVSLLTCQFPLRPGFAPFLVCRNCIVRLARAPAAALLMLAVS